MTRGSITFKSYSYFYLIKGQEPVLGCRDISIRDIREKEFICVVGPNGSGKSTFLDCIAGRLKIRKDQGSSFRLTSQGEEPATLKVAYIPQNAQDGLAPDLTILENIALKAMSFSRSGPQNPINKSFRKKVTDAFTSLGLSEDLLRKLSFPPNALSGGQQQLINIISAALSSPDIVVADEPTSKLDEQNRVRVWNLLYKLASSDNIPVIAATHDHEMAGRIADRIVRMRRGESYAQERLRTPDIKRFLGEIRWVQDKSELPPEFTSYDPEWWKPGKLFPEPYKKCDDSKWGYLANHPMSRNDRTLREVNGVLSLLENSQRKITILDIPCGWGRHAFEFARRGIEVIGMDLCEDFLNDGRSSAASTDGLSITFKTGDMRNIPLNSESVDVVVNLWTSFGYFSDEENKRVLQEFSRVLKPGGQLIIHSDINPERVKLGIFDEPPSRELVSGGFMEVKEFYCQNEHSIYGSWRRCTDEQCTDEHAYAIYRISLYDLDDWRSMANNFNLKLIAQTGGFAPGERTFSDKSQEVILHFKKNCNCSLELPVASRGRME
jgi:ABC-type lipoprotein export system ATPase subunit/SAM-dependent methyltransferase